MWSVRSDAIYPESKRIDTTSIIDLQFYEFTSAYPLSSERPMKIKEDGLTFEKGLSMIESIKVVIPRSWLCRMRFKN